MHVSFYAHAWQAFVMFLAGGVSVFASMMGYLSSGGSEELLQQSLLRVMKPGGKASFDSIKTELAYAKIKVRGFRHSDIREGSDQVSGLSCDEFEVRLDLWPWPPEIESVHIHGMRDLKLSVQRGFLQKRGRSEPESLPFPIYFDGIDLKTRIGDGPELRLGGCRGVFRGSKGAGSGLSGELTLEKLNGQPFPFTLTAHADGRWSFLGTDLKIDTKAIEQAGLSVGNDPLDPVDLLLGALLTGKLGAQGTVSLKVDVQPASAKRAFKCEGHIAYQNLTLQFPPQETAPVDKMPTFLGWMLGRPNSIWPHWLLPDSIQTGPKGRLFFQMEENRLEFHCDRNSVFVPRYGGQDQAPLRMFRGSIEADHANRPKSIFLAADWGPRLDCRLTMARKKDGDRRFDLVLQPNRDAQHPDNKVPLWRFRSVIEDLSGRRNRKKGLPLLRFSVDVNSDHCPDTLLLPPGALDFSGRFRAKGQYGIDRVLMLDEILWEEGGFIYGGPKARKSKAVQSHQIYGSLFDGFRELWGSGEQEWRLQDMTLKGKARIQFDKQANWGKAELLEGQLVSGRVSYLGLTTDLGAAGISVKAEMNADTTKPDEPGMRIMAGVKNGTVQTWAMMLTGRSSPKGVRTLRFEEKDVPLEIHPEREKLKGTDFVSGTVLGMFYKKVNRLTTLTQEGEKLVRKTEVPK